MKKVIALLLVVAMCCCLFAACGEKAPASTPDSGNAGTADTNKPADKPADKTDDKVLFYAAATVLQLYIAESSEHMREMYNVAYSMPNSSEIIFHKLTEKQQEVFSPYLPGWEVKDFYEREIASAGIMRNHISVPCDIYYTMDRKIKTFLESTLLIYRVPDEKIAEAVAFISQFDWPTIADRVIATMLAYLESKT